MVLAFCWRFLCCLYHAAHLRCAICYTSYYFTIICVHTYPHMKVLLAATVGVFPWYLYRYDEYLCTATVDNEYVGVLQALVGYIRYITPAVPGLFLAFGLVNVVFLCAYLVLFVSIVYSLYASFYHKNQLQAITPHDSVSQKTFEFLPYSLDLQSDGPSLWEKAARKCKATLCRH